MSEAKTSAADHPALDGVCLALRASARAADGCVSISSMKRWAYQSLRHDSHLRSILLVEPEFMTRWEFLAKVSTWLKIAELEEPRRSAG